jgi:hypothetical protein
MQDSETLERVRQVQATLKESNGALVAADLVDKFINNLPVR